MDSQNERVVLRLREMLLRGQFSAGERLAELTLAPMLEASRTPVRLALERLAHEGLLQAQSSGGFRVREFAVADIWDAIEVRGVLEGTAARLAAERLGSAGELRELERLAADMAVLLPLSGETFPRYLELNDAFHAELWRLAKSPVLVRMIEAAIALPFAAPGAVAEETQTGIADAVAMEHHRSIIEAIRNREGARAEALAREHSRVARRNLERALADRELRQSIPGASLIRMPAGA